MMMPKMTGLSLFQRVKELYPDVAVVFVTAVDDLSIAVEHLKQGAYDYLVKPVTRRRLQEVVEEALDRRKAMLDQKQHQKLLNDRVSRETKELEAWVKELRALNRMFQAELTERFTVEEAAEGGSDAHPGSAGGGDPGTKGDDSLRGQHG